MLRFHQRTDVFGDVRARRVIGIGTLMTLDHPTAIRKEVGDDVGLIEPRILGLHVEKLISELDVVVESHLRAPKARAAHLGFQAGQLVGAKALYGVVEIRVLTRYTLHSLESHL